MSIEMIAMPMSQGWRTSRLSLNMLSIGIICGMLSACATAKHEPTLEPAPAPVASAPVPTSPVPPSTTAAPEAAEKVDGESVAHVDRGARPNRGSRETQTGYATYLAASFHGNESASGEVFDERKLIAAHRTLPFGSMVRVTNLENGRSVKVRIIDRGPYGKNYREGTIIDLSRSAAQRVGMIHDGQVRVRVVVLKLGDS
jgi:rare lipoprotein A